MWWSLAAALVASVTALVVAFVAYPLQKRHDRHLQLQMEKRKAYQDFFSATSEYFSALFIALYRRDGAAEVLAAGSRHFAEMNRQKVNLAYYARQDVLEQCYRYVDCLDIFRSHLNRELNDRRLGRLAQQVETFGEAKAFLLDARKRAITLARADALHIAVEDASKGLARVFEPGDDD
jgi:hypothetical protein